MNKEELIKLLEELQGKLRDTESESEAKRLLHELQVHQVELEMQNRELREARALIEEARDRYAELYDFAPVGYVVLDERGLITEINLTGASMLGKERSNIIGRPFFGYLNHQDVTPFMHILKECREKGKKVVAEVGLLKDGATLHVQDVQVVCVPAVDTGTSEKVVRAALTDISERKKAEALSAALAGEKATRAESERRKVEESEATYRAIGEAIPFGVWIASADGHMEYLSRSFLDMLGKGLDECSGMGWTECLTGATSERVRRQWEECIRGGMFCDLEYKVKGADNRLYDILLRGIPIRDENGRIIRWAGINIDITGRKEIEEALAEEKERLAVTLRSIGEGVITVNNDGTVFFINKEAEELTGWERKDAAGKMIGAVLDVAAPGTVKRLEPYAAFEKAGRADFSGELVLIDRAGSQKLITGKIAPIMDRAGRKAGDVIVFRDITIRKKLEEEMLKIRKLESLGTLAAGIAHEFSNLLSSIKGNIELALDDMSGRDARERLVEAENIIDAAKALSTQLRTYVAGVKPSRELAYIDEIVKDSIELALKDSNIRRVTHFPGGQWCFVDVDGEQMRQAFYNIFLNAREAMPEGGSVEVTIEPVDIGVSNGLPLKAGKYLKTTIKDTGTSISRDDLGKIFDPFFTTKARRMGLGLAIAFSVVRNHDGLITAESEEGRGAAFRVYLPLYQREKIT